MKEAFRKVIEDSPESSLAGRVQQGIKTNEWEKEEIQREKELRELGDKLAELGILWYQARIDPQTPLRLRRNESITKLREIWKRLESQLVRYRQGERMVLLDKVFEGMWLSEKGNLNLTYTLLAAEKNGNHPFTPASMIFISGISDLMGYSAKNVDEFTTFLQTNANPKSKIDLPEVFRGVNTWIEQRRTFRDLQDFRD